MYLKRLELKGFKSFASKIVMDLETGVTGVVGPNGSGKSNISDGIKWVLGEQSAKTLRGAKMEDVIFSGTEKTKALGMAEVSIVLDNEDGGLPIDYGEVKVTRRAYRSGENEYLINQSPCRLKDVRELFMDTGIGKDGYSIVGQGKIDEILSHKAEDRRRVIEEAVGIVKYKTRKEEAQRKLKGTEENLSRVADILRELENRIEPLKEQKEKAETYQRIYKKLKLAEIHYSIEEIGKSKEKIEQILTLEEALKEEKSGVEDELRSLVGKREELQEEIEAREEEINHNQRFYYEKKEELQRERGNEKLLEGEEEHLKAQQKRDKEQIRSCENRICEIENEIQQVEQALKTLGEEKGELLKELSHDEEIYDGVQEKARKKGEGVERAKGEIIEDMNRLSDWKVDLANLTSLEKSLREREVTLRDRQEKNRERIRRQRKEIGGILKEKDEKGSLHQKVKENLESTLSLMRDREKETSRREKELNIRINGRETKKQEIRFLRGLEENKEGFQRSVKTLLKESEKDQSLKKGLYGAVGDLIKVPRGYEVAIETALGYAVQNLVVEDEDAGKKLINYCKNRKLGKITVLPRTTIGKKGLQPREKEVLCKYPEAKVAGEITEYPGKLAGIFSNLLGRVVIVPTLEDAIPLAKELKHRTKIVTYEGDLMNTGGSMTGGSQGGKSQGILSRKGKLTTLIKEYRLDQEWISEKDQELQKVKVQLQEEEEKKDLLEEELQVIVIELAKLREQLQQKEEALKSFDEEEHSMEEEIIQLRETAKNNQGEYQGLEVKIKELEVSLGSNREKIQEQEKALQEEARRMEILRESIQEKRVAKASYEEKEQSGTREIQSLKGEIQRQEDDIQLYRENLRKAEDKKLEIHERKQQLTRLKQEIEETLEKTREEHKIMEEGKKNLSEKEKNLVSEEKLLESRVREISEKISHQQMKSAKIEVQLENLYQNLWERYEMSYAQGLSYLEGKEGRLSQREMQKLKQEIKALGHVNLDSILEYQETMERFEFLGKQHKDLMEGKKSLLKIIREMELTMSLEFIEGIQEIRRKFNETFTRLFGGGKADLVLEDEEDPLNTGINIVARPPGKKLQNLSLLSGGERSLTAIALLFAILEIKPSPFCVLDEIEAALDESNVGRFAKFLKELAEETQFIVVTHRKGTMEAADVLYGVTMEKEGVSKLVSVKIQDYVEEET